MFGIDISTNYNTASQKTKVFLLAIGAITKEDDPEVGVIALKMLNRIS